MSIKGNYLTILNLQTACTYRKNINSYKLLTTQLKMLRKERILSFKIKACPPICKLLKPFMSIILINKSRRG